MHRVKGGCHCGNINLQIELPSALYSYRPRACDCDFCTKHMAAFISDPKGSLSIWISDESARGTYFQGSNQAEFLLCKNCGVFIGALYRADGRIFGTVNARVLAPADGLSADETVSPKKLSAAAKTQRWQTIWFADVVVASVGPPA
jgi:hypothetical protein